MNKQTTNNFDLDNWAYRNIGGDVNNFKSFESDICTYPNFYLLSMTSKDTLIRTDKERMNFLRITVSLLWCFLDKESRDTYISLVDVCSKLEECEKSLNKDLFGRLVNEAIIVFRYFNFEEQEKFFLTYSALLYKIIFGNKSVGFGNKSVGFGNKSVGFGNKSVRKNSLIVALEFSKFLPEDLRLKANI